MTSGLLGGHSLGGWLLLRNEDTRGRPGPRYWLRARAKITGLPIVLPAIYLALKFVETDLPANLS